MIDPVEEQRQRLEQLLVDRATGVLSRADLPELRALLERHPDLAPEAFERAAAALDLAFHTTRQTADDSLPSELQRKILADASQFLQAGGHSFAESESSADIGTKETVRPTEVDLRAVNGHTQSTPSISQDGKRGGWLRWGAASGWLVAAALLLLAVFMQQSNVPAAADAVSLAEQRKVLLTRNGTLQLDWQAGKHPFEEPVVGDVIWNQSAQSGFMTFQGLPVNDPTLEQYQLWIIDPSRDDEPIDGGVFDVDNRGRVIIPIDNKLPTIDPQGFAVTIEKPGGVVVSTQERLPLLALVQ